MGIRITKAIGYGITGMPIDPKDYMRTCDSRVNFDSPIFTGDYDDDFTDSKYVQRLAEKTEKFQNADNFEHPDFDLLFSKFMVEESISKTGSKESLSVAQGIIYNGEYGDAGTILFIPPGMSYTWQRYDDAIDSMESTLNNPTGYDLEPEVKSIPYPPYPFSGWMDSATGQQITSEDNEKLLREMLLMDRAEASPKLSEKEREQLKPLRDKLTQKYGYENYADYKEQVVPLVPMGVRDLIEWTGALMPGGWKHLRPMLYTYWG